MNILFLTWKDIKHPFFGGAENVIYEYAKGLAKKGHNVTWFASNFDGGKSEEIIDSIKIIRKYTLNTIYFKAFFWYRKFKKNNQIDIIIDEAGGIPLLSPLYERKIPIYFLIHHIGDKEWEEKFNFPLSKIFKYIYFKIIKLYKNKKTITVSPSTKNELIKNFSFREKNITVIENACNIKPISEINFDKKEDSILFLGRLMPIKRVEDSILAFYNFTSLNKKFKNYKLEIIGDNQDKQYVDKLNKIIENLNLEKKVRFLGHIDKKDFESFMLRQKLILVTSIKEGFGLIVLESNSYGIPALGYEVSGLKDSIKNNKNGFLIEDGDYEGMGEKISDILSNEELYKKLSLDSLNYVKTLDSRKKKVDIFEEIIK